MQQFKNVVLYNLAKSSIYCLCYSLCITRCSELKNLH